MAKVLVRVTQDHIDAAESMADDHRFRRCEACPIALALSTAGFPDAVVGGSNLWLYGVKKSVAGRIPMNKQCRAFITNFDFNGYTEPFSFYVEVK